MASGDRQNRFSRPMKRESHTERTHDVRRAIVNFWKWALFPFAVFATALLVALYAVNLLVPAIWYMRLYFYLFVVTQIWMVTQFFLYLNYRKIRYDFGDRYSEPVDDSEVSVIVSCYNEPSEILEKTLQAIRAYFTGTVYLADDSTEELGKTANLAEKYETVFLHRKDRQGFKAGAINNALKQIKTPYVILLDSDAVPSGEFFHISKCYIYHYDFVQFPQYYANRSASYVALGAYAQQVPFMFRIMPLRSQRGSAFMLGTNLIFKKDAVLKVGGFDEDSITEDLSTSLMMHEVGCTSVYVDRSVVSNSAPLTLKAYFTQQERWARGTLGVFRQISYSSRQKLGLTMYSDYLIGSSWYIYGFAFLFMTMSVFLFALFKVQFLLVPYLTYVTLFVPYLILTLLIYYTTIKETGHGVKEVFLNMSFNAICFPIYIKALILAIVSKNKLFKRTPKKVTNSTFVTKYTRISPQLALITMLLISVIVNITDAWFGFYPVESIINAVWGSFYTALLLPIYLYPY